MNYFKHPKSMILHGPGSRGEFPHVARFHVLSLIQGYQDITLTIFNLSVSLMILPIASKSMKTHCYVCDI